MKVVGKDYLEDQFQNFLDVVIEPNFQKESEALTLGETAGTAYEGSKGKANADSITAINGKIPSGASSSNQLVTENDLDTKVDKVSGKGLSTNDYDASAKAAVDALGTASALNVPASGNASSSEVVKGDDTRLTDSRNAADVYSWAKQATKPSYSASEVGAIASTDKGANGGVAELDSSGKVPSSQLPSYVDDVLEYNSLSDFPATGETGKIYIAKDTNKTYRWSGTAYVEISESLALGETSSTAYAGNKGKANADAISAIKDGTTIDSFGDVEGALSDKVSKSSTAGLLKNDGTVDTTTTGAVSANTSAISAIKDGTTIDSFGDVETALAGKQATLTFDNIPTENSNNPVKSGGVYTALSTKISTSACEQLVEDTVGWTGKNRLKCTLSSIKAINTSGTWSGNKYTINGTEYTITVGDDGDTVEKITVNTPSSSTANANLLLNMAIPLDTGESYIISDGLAEHNSNRYIRIGNATDEFVANTSAGESEFTATATMSAKVYVKNGATVSNLDVYPMIRRADISDSTFEPYHASVDETLQSKMSVNLFNNADVENGAYNSGTGEPATTDSYKRTKNPIKVSGGTTYVLSNFGGSDVRTFYYKADGTYISYDAMVSGTFTTPAETTYLRMRWGVNYNISRAQVEKGSVATAYQPYIETVGKSLTGKADKTEVQATQQLVEDTVGWSGKNVGEYFPYGVTGDASTGYRINENGSCLIAKAEKNTKYIFSKDYTVGDRFRIIGYINYPTTVSDTTAYQIYSNSQQTEDVEYTNTTYNYFVFVFQSAAPHITGDTAKAMIRKVGTSSGYEPYHASVDELMFTREEQGVLGAVNIIPYPYIGDAGASGLTVAENEDTSITISAGTSTGNFRYKLFENIKGSDLKKFWGNNNTYKMKGTPANGSTSTWYFRFSEPYQSSNWSHYDDIGNGILFNTADLKDDSNYSLVCCIDSGVTLASDITFKPMISLGDSEFVPPSMTNKQLTDKVQAIIDAVNNSADYASFKTAIGNL